MSWRYRIVCEDPRHPECDFFIVGQALYETQAIAETVGQRAAAPYVGVGVEAEKVDDEKLAEHVPPDDVERRRGPEMKLRRA